MKKVDAAVENRLMLKCNKCQDILKYNIYCQQCHILADNISMNYFDIFAFKQQYNIDLENLEQSYFELLQFSHPDKYHANEQLLLACRYSSIINKAYQTLSHDRLRGEYILSLNNIIVNGENDTIKPDMHLITEIFELRDDLESITDFDQLNEFIQNIILQIKNIKTQIPEKFENNQYHIAGEILIKLRYFEKILEEAKLKKRNI
jgi:molecular chaperone HscB